MTPDTPRALRVHPSDNTATALCALPAGSRVRILGTDETVVAREEIPFAHKIALVAVECGEPVLKYGQVIGRATRDIAPGGHVHVRNTESLRGRGDLQGTAPAVEDGLPAVFPAPGTLTLEAPAADWRGRTFLGWPRPDGRAGTRSLVGVLSAVVCANDVACSVSDEPGAAVFTHQQGCSQLSPDVRSVERVLLGLAANPNLGAVVFLSLGCESVDIGAVVEKARGLGKPVAHVVIQEEGGKTASEAKLRALVRRFAREIDVPPQPVPIEKLVLGLKCGSSDTTQGLSANVALGRVTDMLVRAGARVVIGETTEFLGAEHLAAARCRDADVAAKLLERVRRMEECARAVGVDMRGGQPTRGNIAGGLTTIEEKSLGALEKSGSAVFQDVIDYGAPCTAPGLTMMDSPGREPELLTGLAAAGCNVIAFSTGRGAPQGFPFVPVMKITGNERTWERMREHMDCCAAGILTGEATVVQCALAAAEKLLAVAGGEPCAAERTRYVNSMNIWTTGPVV